MAEFLNKIDLKVDEIDKHNKEILIKIVEDFDKKISEINSFKITDLVYADKQPIIAAFKILRDKIAYDRTDNNETDISKVIENWKKTKCDGGTYGALMKLKRNPVATFFGTHTTEETTAEKCINKLEQDYGDVTLDVRSTLNKP